MSGSGCTSRSTLSLRSTHMRIALGTTTIPGVALDMTPSDSIRFSSASTLGRSGNGTCLGVYREWGFASGLSGISYSSPNPEKTDGNTTSVVVDGLVTSATRIASFRAVIAGSPSFDHIDTLFCFVVLFSWVIIPWKYPLVFKV